ncbi:MAG TPA: hypothetical protein PLO61_03180 [Fimbriimonadaceae bacterium]|nr:hypothetical protein [Fimbriimonadaceae bacterium]HRJ32112.1 hypothetical protein [Fimbriimonadaceae bacterium]
MIRTILTVAGVWAVSTAGAQTTANKLDSSFFDVLTPRSLGPTTMGGRIMDLAVYEPAPRIFYIGVAGGGVWKTVNGGLTVESVFDNDGPPAVGAVAVSQKNPDLVWVGTGEGSSRNSTSWGDGVYKSEDGGKTWKNMGLPKSFHIPRILIDPKDNNTVWVAALGQLWGANPDRGVYKTTDGGKSWKQVLFVDEKSGIADIAMDPKNPNTILAASWERMRKPYSWASGGPGSGLYKTTDGGKSWRKITKGLPETTLGRIGLSYFQADPKIVMATIEARGGGTFRSTDGGESWTKVNNLNPRPFYFSQPHYDPVNVDRLFVLGVSFHMSLDTGKTFRTVPMDVHVDHHAMWINPKDNGHWIIGNDGGVAQTRDDGRTWQHINGMPLGQYYAIGYDMRKPYWVYGGLQDNGSWAFPTQTRRGGVAYYDAYGVGGGDGFYVQVDPNDWKWLYSESQGGAISRLNQQTGESRFIRPRPPQGERYRFNWNAPIFISPHNSATIYFGGNRLFKSVDRGDNWRSLGGDLTTYDPAKQSPGGGVTPEDTGAERHCTITTIGESPLRQGLLWVGTDDGNIQVSTDDGASWTNVVGNIPNLPKNAWVTRVTPSRFAENRCYVTIDHHRENDYNSYVFVTEDLGKTWTKLSNDLGVNECAHVIKEGTRNEDLLFLGTELSLWISLDRGKNWIRYQTNEYPNMIHHDLAVHPRELDLIIGTHSRSIWILPISPLEEMTAANRAKDMHLCKPTAMQNMGRVGVPDWDGDGLFFSANTQPMARIYYHLKTATDKPVKVQIKRADGEILGDLTGSRNAGLNQVEWSGRARGRSLAPGDYSVILTVDDKSATTMLTVEDISDEMGYGPLAAMNLQQLIADRFASR